MTGDDTFSTGIQGEEIACRHLARKGYEIVDRNWRSGHYEIDIIAGDGNTLVFCEVKTARSRRFGDALGWITPRKVRRIATAALDYLSVHDIQNRPLRFDVIALDIHDGELSVTHLENAFDMPGSL